MSTEERALTSWERVDTLVRSVAILDNGFWLFKIEHKPENVYEVIFTRGPGTAWVSFKYLPRPADLKETFARVFDETSEKGGTAG